MFFSSSQSVNAGALGLFCPSLDNSARLNASKKTEAQLRKVNAKLSREVYATLNVGNKKLPCLVKTAGTQLRGVNPRYRKLFRSPVDTLVYASAKNYRVNELKRRAGNSAVPYFPLLHAIWTETGKPITPDIIKKSSQKPETAFFQFLQPDQILNASQILEANKKVAELLERNVALFLENDAEIKVDFSQLLNTSSSSSSIIILFF